MLSDLRLQHFRSYDDSSFEFSEGVNIIVGPNASGKTNILEAILILARGSSYRAKDSELTRFDQPWARLDSDLSEGGTRTLKLTTETLPAKLFELNGKSYQRLSLQHTLPVVLFEPEDLRLLSGGPERRRDYLDDLLEQTTAGYRSLRRQYRQTLAQRNALLKRASGSIQAQMFPWDIRLSQLAGQIVRLRDELVEKMNQQAPDLYKNLSGTTVKISLRYVRQWPPDSYESNLLKKLESSLASDRERGFTSAGPHRDDLAVLFDGHPSQETASRGEVRTAVLTLKIIELKLLETARGITPLLLLDDVFSELDGRRRHALTDHLAAYQTFITTTDADLVTKHFTNKSNIILLK
ncbi:MAG: DNA replication and repair protein RecF [Candidatus Saccharimonadales bacterium]